MKRHGPRDQGRRPGEKSSYGAKHLSDAEDSLVVRKKNLHPQSRGRLSSSDNLSVGGYPEDRRAQDYDDDDDDDDDAPILRSRLGGDDSKDLQDLDAHYKKLKIANLGPNFPYDDHDEMDINDIGRLRMHRDIRSEQVKHARTPAEREFLADAVEMINEDIARYEYKERHGLWTNPQQNRARNRRGSRDSPDRSRNPSDRFEHSQLEKDLQSEMRNASRFAESGDNYGLQMAEANVERLSEIVERFQLESRHGGRLERRRT